MSEFNGSIRGQLEKQLFGLGMFEEQARQVLDNMVANMPEMAERWNDTWLHYPLQMQPVLWITTKSYALEWVNENLPNAWYKPLLEGKQ